MKEGSEEPHIQWIYIVCYYVIGVLFIITAFIGNVLIIVYFGFKVKKKTPYIMFLLALAISDLSGTVSCLCLLIQFSMFMNNSIQVPDLCMIMRPLTELFLGISSFLIVGMSYERYRGITKAMQYRVAKKRFVVAYFVAVSVAWALYGIPLYIPDEQYNLRCRIKATNNLFIYSVTVVVVKSVIPSILMCFFYFQIKNTLREQQKRLEHLSTLKRNKAVLRTLKLLIIFFETFVVIPSIIPAINYEIMLATTEDWKSWNYLLDASALGFPVFNNAVNCFVYAGYVKEFRRFLMNIFCRRFIRRKQSMELEMKKI